MSSEFLVRHVRGDWGEFGQFDAVQLTADEQRRGWEATDDSGKINKSNVLNRCDRVMSEDEANTAAKVGAERDGRLDSHGGC